MPVLRWYAAAGVLFLWPVAVVRLLSHRQCEIRRGQAPTLLTVLRWKRVRNSATDGQLNWACPRQRVKPWVVSQDAACGRRGLNTFVEFLKNRSSLSFWRIHDAHL